MKRRYLLAVAVMLSSGLNAARADTDSVVTLQQERQWQSGSIYYGCADTNLLEGAGSRDEYKNFGIDNDPNDYTKYRNLQIRWAANSSASYWVGLIRFDLSMLPTNWNITSATLSLYHWDDTNMGSGDWVDMALYPLRKSWTEGSGPHNGDERTGATWLYQYATGNDTLWTTPGARGSNSDRDTSPDNTQRVYYNQLGWTTFASSDVTATVREWYSGSRTNYGWQIDTTNSSDDLNGAYFHNSEWSTSSPDYVYRPALNITYTVPEPTSLCLLALGTLTLLRRRK